MGKERLFIPSFIIIIESIKKANYVMLQVHKIERKNYTIIKRTI